MVSQTMLKGAEGAVQFWIGDYLNYGERKYGEEYAQAVDGKRGNTWRTYARVSNRVQLSMRVDNLSVKRGARSVEEKLRGEGGAAGRTRDSFVSNVTCPAGRTTGTALSGVQASAQPRK
jgi:hypothetical protein